MITRTMNLNEIEEELKKDFPNPEEFFEKLRYREKKLVNRKTLLRDTIKRMFDLSIGTTVLNTEKYISSRNNQYLIAYAISDKKNGSFLPFIEIYVIIPRDAGGKMRNDYGRFGGDKAVEGGGRDAVCLGAVITGHYVDRVRERYPNSNKLSLCDILLDVPENQRILGYINTDRIRARNLQELEVIKDFTEGNRQDIKTKSLGYSSVSVFTTEKHPNTPRPMFKTFKLALSGAQENKLKCSNKIRFDVNNGDLTLLKEEVLKELEEKI